MFTDLFALPPEDDAISVSAAFQQEWRRQMDSNREGLESRAFRLLTCTDKEWLSWLDNLDFWKAGWKPEDESEDEN